MRPHPFFERDGYDVWYNVTVSFAQAALGASLLIPTLDGKVKWDLPAGTQPGEVFLLRGKGIQKLNSRDKGNQLIRVVVDVPKKLSDKQKELIRQLGEELPSTAETTEKEEKHSGIFGKKKK